jgi:hypothetical protein
MLMKYFKYLICAALLVNIGAAAQEKTVEEEAPAPLFSDKKIKPIWMEKLRYGGSIALQFWGQLYIDLSPMVGYELGNSGKTVVGLSPTANYIGTFKAGNYAAGGRVFIRQSLFRKIFAHAEFETINAPSAQFYQFQATDPKRSWGQTPYIGLGLYQGGKAHKGPFIMILANPLYPNKGYKSPYQFGGGDSPLTLRVGFF